MILSIETSTSACSVSLHQVQSGEVRVYLELQIEKSHSSFLTILLDQALRFGGVDMRELKAIVVSSGPGSYTGLRIGSSAAKGLCYALEIPLIGVNALEAMRAEVNSYYRDKDDVLLCPMIDARRMEVYSAIYDSKGYCIKEPHPLIVKENSFDEFKDKDLLFFGNGSLKCQKVLTDKRFRFLEGIVPTAKWLGKIGVKKYHARQYEDVAYFEPDYLKEFMTTVPKAKLNAE
ncbi:MAG: tRNA (adenosine(37)-N6)-threonylcarbamoyltransferase complex dimerization subunit type 1 TsaB [Flammeovirgaceae bacterium]